MSSEPDALLGCAEQIAGLGDSDATCRAVVSRGYYAAYHAAKRFHENLATPGYVMGATGRHQQLLNQLAYPGISDKNKKYKISVALAKTLRPVYAARVDADYFLEITMEKGRTSQILQACRGVIEVTAQWIEKKVA